MKRVYKRLSVVCLYNCAVCEVKQEKTERESVAEKTKCFLNAQSGNQTLTNDDHSSLQYLKLMKIPFPRRRTLASCNCANFQRVSREFNTLRKAGRMCVCVREEENEM